MAVTINGHEETIPLRGAGATDWLRQLYYRQSGKPANAQAVQDALNLIRARALYDGEEHEVHVRVAGGHGVIYLDLADGAGRVVAITEDGWTVIDSCPLRFIRPKGLLPLPLPAHGGSIDDLRPFVNVSDDDQFRLMVSWLVAALSPWGPYPILQLAGQQGSAKSTTARVLRSLVDPNVSPLRSEPREARDLMIAATNAHVVTFDNISRMPSYMSDALCRLATGGGFSTRQLYTDGEEVIFEGMAPVILTGIEEQAERGDLVERSIIITLPPISDAERRTERTVRKDFEAAAPRILGALLDALVLVVRHRDAIELPGRPRMADFAVTAAAAAPELGWDLEQFLLAYQGNRDAAKASTVESSSLALAVVQFMESRTEYSATASELKDELELVVGEQVVRRRTWPKDATRLSGELRRLAPSLEALGVHVVFGEREPGRARRRLITLERMADVAVPVSAASDSNQGENEDVDAGGRYSVCRRSVRVTHA
ncbi:MAG: hypothetical protein R2706_19670 [Acidimicrobiales bacterium]